MPDFVIWVDFSQYEHDRGEVMRQRIDGNKDDGIRYLLDDLRDADMPDSPLGQEEQPELSKPEEPLEPEESKPTAKAFFDMMASTKRPLYEGAKISQLDAIAQVLANKAQFDNTRACIETHLTAFGNMLPEGHCLPKTMYEAKKILKALNMDYVKYNYCPKGCLLFWKDFADDKYCNKCGPSRYHDLEGPNGQKTQTKVAVKILCYLPFIKRI
jgi:hypothetical protein